MAQSTVATIEQVKLVKEAAIPLTVKAGDDYARQEYIRWKLITTELLSGINDEKIKMIALLYSVRGNNISLVQNCTTATEVMELLDNTYLKQRNVTLARQKLRTRVQLKDESVQDFARSLSTLVQDCNFTSTDVKQRVDEEMSDSLLLGLRNPDIRARCFEHETMSFQQIVKMASTIEESLTNSKNNIPCSAMEEDSESSSCALLPENNVVSTDLNVIKKNACTRCGYYNHVNKHCPALTARCKKCSMIGHYAKRCKTKSVRPASIASTGTDFNQLSIEYKCKHCCRLNLESFNKDYVIINNKNILTLFDTGSDENFISESVLSYIGNPKLVQVKEMRVRLADGNETLLINKACNIDLTYKSKLYKNVRLLVFSSTLNDLILGGPFFKLHNKIVFSPNGDLPSFQVARLEALRPLMEVAPFQHLSSDIKPIAIKSRKYSPGDEEFISSEISRLLDLNIIEESSSPWRAQLLVVKKSENPRLVIDYSQTINRFTYADAYPLPNIETLVNGLAANNYFTKIDLKNAYHQIPINSRDYKYTAFEANGRLFHFKRLSFGLTNGSQCFQRVMNSLVERYKLSKVYPYLDDITIAGTTKEEHDNNLSAFLKVARSHNLTFNDKKCIYGVKSIKILGYEISDNQLRPDPDRMQGIINYPIPDNMKSLGRLRGMLAYYARWIRNFSGKIEPLVKATLPLNEMAVSSIRELIKELGNSVRAPINYDKPFVVETDASKHSISGTLSQEGRPVSFFSRTLNKSEISHSIIEKESYAIIESIRRWHHLLKIMPFKIITDQRSVSFIFDDKHEGVIKNEKIARWKIELMPYKFTIEYRPGRENVAADALSRMSNLESKRKITKNKLRALEVSVKFNLVDWIVYMGDWDILGWCDYGSMSRG